MFENYSVRADARTRLKGFWLNCAVIVLLYAAISGGLSYLLNQIIGVEQVRTVGEYQVTTRSSSFTSIIMLLVEGPLAFGFAYVFLELFRSGSLETGNLFKGFTSLNFIKSVLLNFFVVLFTALWALLLIIPGIIKGLSYSMSFFVMIDNPNYTWKECIEESKMLTDGYKGQLFLLFLSFIGWAILSIFTLGIGYFFLASYMQMSLSAFYQNLRSIKKPETVQPLTPEEHHFGTFI